MVDDSARGARFLFIVRALRGNTHKHAAAPSPEPVAPPGKSGVIWKMVLRFPDVVKTSLLMYLFIYFTPVLVFFLSTVYIFCRVVRIVESTIYTENDKTVFSTYFGLLFLAN